MKKGKFYYGPVGVGKTTRMKKEFDVYESKGKRWITARQIARIAQANGLLGVEQTAHSALDFFVDDIGHEATIVNHFGTVLSPMAEFILGCYESFQEQPQSKFNRSIHFTSNLSLDELRIRYGDFIFDRLVEMCEWIHIEGQSFRK